ncbi:Flp pilus assembly protein CpaB [Magnetospirillum sp. UT-4]|uniref:Flp pilus assembly protein CpaB n=1 Tax=Magnetospirillum sp. UT-4 TaxID=2681467 RepID=UPI00137C7001|nr:Flp pilus assembly protein CpaB [Magnetospirillum sp. UT-4]CAA7625883.1 putative flp pilus assembly CpaB [Magnetospirillum sp. UT-4]
MKPVVIVLMAVAVAAASATAFLAQRWVSTQAARPVATQAAPVAEVLVVAREVAAGTALAEADLRYEPWPANAAQRFVARKPGEDPRAQMVGLVTRRALAEGEPFTQAAAAKPDAGLLAGLLAPGMRAVSVAISNASAVSGFVAPGDRVDVVMAADFQRADQDSVGKGGPIVRFAAETVLRDVKVLAIDQQIARGKDGAAIQGKTATIEVSPKQAEAMIAAGMMGQLSLVLRPQAREEEAPETTAMASFTADIEASKAMRALNGEPRTSNGGGGVRINRAGTVSTGSY